MYATNYRLQHTDKEQYEHKLGLKITTITIYDMRSAIYETYRYNYTNQEIHKIILQK